ncbi:MAG: hypothetical protein ACOCXZ_00550 [Chloroflexota bacterium]
MITDVDRHHVGPVEVALATRPRTVKAGREFEVIMLIQNTLDCPVDVTATLQLPAKDHEGQAGRFLTGTERLVVGVAPAEVGYVTLPMSTMPDTAIGSDYMIGMDVSAKPLAKGQRIRHDGGSLFNPETVPASKRDAITDLQKLRFSTRQRRGFLRSGTVLETPIAIIQGKIGRTPDFKPGWTSLWTLEDQQDPDLLIAKYGELMRQKVLPGISKDKLFEPMVRKTFTLFKQAGYTLTKEETFSVTRLLLCILDYAAGHTGSAAAGIYDVMGTLRYVVRERERIEKARLIGEEPEIKLPHWAIGYMQLLAKDERVARVPNKVIPELLYDAVLRDALEYGLRIVERDSGENLGGDEEMAAYVDIVIGRLRDGDMDFGHAYLPLVIGGFIVTDQVLIGDERVADVMKSLRFLLEKRENEIDEHNEPVYHMAKFILESILKKYGFLNNR